MAQELVDTKLLAKLNEGNLSATEAKYFQDYTMPRDYNTKKSAENSALEVSQGIFCYLIYNLLMNNILKRSDTL